MSINCVLDDLKCVLSFIPGETCSVNIDDCASEPCQGEGTVCVDEVGGYECHCSPGFAGSDCHIPDPDACGSQRCFVDGGICQWSAPSNYTCVCKPGFKGELLASD